MLNEKKTNDEIEETDDLLTEDAVEETVTNETDDDLEPEVVPIEELLGDESAFDDFNWESANKHGVTYSKEERERLTEKYYFVVQNARKAMGLDFIDQLMQHPNECIPPLAGDILNYLSIYAKLHPGAEIYIVVPYAGSTAPGRLFLWRWDRANGYLIRVEDNTGGFPVRFAALMGGGIGFSGVDVDTPSDEELEGVVEDQQPGAEPDAAQTADAFAPIPNPVIDGVPIYWQLRGHYNRC